MKRTEQSAAQAVYANGRDTRGSDHGLKKNTLGVFDIAFYIVAAASPLTGVIAIVPILLSIGSGVGSPAAFLLAASILLIFAVGYVAMSRYIRNAGALYTYVTLGLGQRAGLGTAALTVFAYTAIQVGLYGGFGYYGAELVFQWTGLSMPWWIFSALAAVLCLLLAVSGVQSGAKVLGVLMTFECLLLFVLAAGMLFNSPDSFAFSFQPFNPVEMVTPGLGVALMFACVTFTGFEGSAIYSEEARDPKRTVPRATYSSVIFMAVVYSGVTWLVVCTLGLDHAVDVATQESGNLIFRVSDMVLGRGATNFFNVFIVTAIFAAIVTFHNNIARYLYALGRQKLVWTRLGHTLPTMQTPYVASTVQTVSAMLIVGAFAALHLDPYEILFATMTGMGAIGILLAQTIAAVGIFVFFRRTQYDNRFWHTLLAPMLAIVGMGTLLYYALTGVELLLGITGGLATFMAASGFITFAAGWCYGFYVKHTQPQKYTRIMAVLTDAQ